MSLVRTSLLNAIAVAVKVGVAMVLNKILAIYVGPAGYAAIGQFQNAVAIAVSLAGGVIGPGVTKGTAEHYDDERRQHALWRTALKLTLAGTAAASLTFVLARPWLADHLLQRQDVSGVFIGLALVLPAIALNNLLLAILNGKKEVLSYVSANVLGNLLSLVIVGMLTYKLGLYGALLGIVISPATVLVATAALALRKPWLSLASFRGKADRLAVKELSGFGLMGLTTAIVGPLSYIFVRDHLSDVLSLQAAGYWQASWKISEIYLMLVTLTLSVYYLPRLAEIKTAGELKKEILKVYSLVLPVVIGGALVIYLLRDFIVRTLFTEDFFPIKELFFWQLAGDILKIGSWILSYIMLGRTMVKWFVGTEIAFSASFCLLTVVLVQYFGIKGVSMAYAVNYALYWTAMAFLMHSEMKSMRIRSNPAQLA